MDGTASANLLHSLNTLDDPRSRKSQQYPMAATIALIWCGLLAGQVSLRGIARWARAQPEELMRHLGFARRTTPSANSLANVLKVVCADQLQQAINQWLANRRNDIASASSATVVKALALDGKTLRRSKSNVGQALQVLSLATHQHGQTIAAEPIPDGKSEITHARQFLEFLDLEGQVITADAAHCHRETCRQIVDSGGDYLVSVKDNQRTLKEGIAEHLTPPEMMEATLSPSAASGMG